MKRVFAYGILATLLTSVAFSQATDNRPTFEVADIHPSPHANQAQFSGPFYGNGRYELQYATMVDLVRTAYGVDAERVSGGPNWLELDRFHVYAKTPPGSTAESRKLMLQSLLADRFKLVVRNESKPVPALTLTAGKHPAMKESDGSGETGCKFAVLNNPGGPPTDGQPIQLPVISYTCHNTTMAAFAAAIPTIPAANQYLDNKPVVDRTGLEGTWDFTLKITPKLPAGIATIGEKMPLLEAIDRQLGLKLEVGTVPMPVIVVESVNHAPTANPPETAKVFPPPPTEFDVAELKPSPPVPAGGRGGQQSPPVLKNGRLIVQNLTLQNLIVVAWDLSGPDMLAGGPKWLNSDKFDLIAKAPSGVEIGDFNAQQINLDALRPMVQALLKERFKMAVHMEDRPVDAYTLMAGKPKLTPADPTGHTKWQEGIGAAGKDTKNANTALGRLVTCKNMTMSQFAELLPQIAPGYVHSPVLNATGIEGAFDFTFSFSPIGALQAITGGKGGDGGGTGDTASDPGGALSLPEALSRQLGLKLELQKRPVKVLVIDHVDEKPTDN